MPGLVRSHDARRARDNPEFMKEIKAKIDKAGVIVLSDAWLAGADRIEKAGIRTPDAFRA